MDGQQIGVIGAGYVGLTSAACLAELGHRVICADIDAGRVAQLRRGVVPAHEPDLGDLVRAGIAAGRLEFVTDVPAAVAGAGLVFLCLPTPMAPGGEADLAALHAVVEQLRGLLPPGCLLVIKSTVPVGTTRDLARRLDRPDVGVASNPEFLREGHAVHDFLRPSRIVVGTDDPATARAVDEVYAGLDAPTVHTDPSSAELVKYASNCLLAVRLSFVNSLAELCERVGGDIADVAEGVGHDPRIGGAFLRPGPGWGGSCLPKDTHALLHTARRSDVDFPLLAAAIDTNTHQQRRVVAKVRTAVTGSPAGSLHGVRLALLGLTFKAGTDDLRDSPAVAVARLLAAGGAELTAHDPCVPAGTDLGLPLRVVDEVSLAAKDASAIVLLTEWPCYRELDWAELAQVMRHPVVVDTRNHLDPADLRPHGVRHHPTGRPVPTT